MRSDPRHIDAAHHLDSLIEARGAAAYTLGFLIAADLPPHLHGVRDDCIAELRAVLAKRLFASLETAQ